jgi:hypothetical protein
MKTFTGSPSRAPAVAVATPCMPAPVSAISRLRPMCRASIAWPITLLILWEPVCVRSSRLSRTVTPSSADSRRAGVSGVGRPAYAESSRARLPRNPGSAHAWANASATAWQAGIRDSGTYRPP